MNERMPWRLQIAIQCMRANWFDPCGPIPSDGAMKDAASLYFRMADAMLAVHARTRAPSDDIICEQGLGNPLNEGQEHARTAPAAESREDKIRHIIDSLSSTPPNGFADACKKRTAIEKLVRMLNESNGGGT